MAISGAYVRATTTDTGAFRPRDNWGTTVDPGHNQSAMGSDQGFPELKRPTVYAVPEEIVDTYDPESDNATYLYPDEREPKGHEGSGRPARSDNRYDEINSDVARHSENFGSTLVNRGYAIMRSITQTFASPLLPSLPLQTDDASASATGAARRALRGFNSHAENNPGSAEANFSGNYTRQGRELYRITDRSMPNRTLTHTRRPIYSNVATIAKETRGPLGENYSPYGSPFTDVASLNVGTARPMMRREPRPYEESVITDGADQSDDESTSQYFSLGMLCRQLRFPESGR
jgi:hypothetical protein